MKRKGTKSSHVTSSGNVFRDLRLPKPEEELTKSALLFEIDRAIRSRDLKQTEAAKLLGIPQPRVSNLLRGRTSGFSVQRLSLLLARLGKGVTIVVSDRPHRAGLPNIPVVRDPAGVVSRMARESFAVDGSRAAGYTTPCAAPTPAPGISPARTRSRPARSRRARS
jgi:predicted XRE-type DNA-binding protein